MSIKSKVIAVLIFAFSLLLSGCGSGQLFGATVTPTPTTTNTPTFTPTATATQTPTPTPTMTPTPTQIGGGSGSIIFELRKEHMAEEEAEKLITAFPDLEGNQNVFIANIDGTNMVPITNGLEGYNYIQDISPDGAKLLIASSEGDYGNLYSIDLNSLESDPVKLASDLPKYSWRGFSAKWIDNTRLVFVGKGEVGFGIYSVNSDGSNQRSIYKYNYDGEGNKPVEILAVSDTHVYWDSQISTSLGGNSSSTNSYPWMSSIDGGGVKEALEFEGKQIVFSSYFYPLTFSPDGNWFTWVEPATKTFHHNYLHLTSLPAMDYDRYIDISSATTDISWLDSSKILIIDRHASRIYTVSVQSLSEKNLGQTDVLFLHDCSSSLGDISPDRRQVMTFSRNLDNECESYINILDLENMSFTYLNFRYKTYKSRGYWIP
jgi:hypothetical protein